MSVKLEIMDYPMGQFLDLRISGVRYRCSYCSVVPLRVQAQEIARKLSQELTGMIELAAYEMEQKQAEERDRLRVWSLKD